MKFNQSALESAFLKEAGQLGLDANVWEGFIKESNDQLNAWLELVKEAELQDPHFRVKLATELLSTSPVLQKEADMQEFLKGLQGMGKSLGGALGQGGGLGGTLMGGGGGALIGLLLGKILGFENPLVGMLLGGLGGGGLGYAFGSGKMDGMLGMNGVQAAPQAGADLKPNLEGELAKSDLVANLPLGADPTRSFEAPPTAPAAPQAPAPMPNITPEQAQAQVEGFSQANQAQMMSPKIPAQPIGQPAPATASPANSPATPQPAPVSGQATPPGAPITPQVVSQTAPPAPPATAGKPPVANPTANNLKDAPMAAKPTAPLPKPPTLPATSPTTPQTPADRLKDLGAGF